MSRQEIPRYQGTCVVTSAMTRDSHKQETQMKHVFATSAIAVAVLARLLPLGTRTRRSTFSERCVGGAKPACQSLRRSSTHLGPVEELPGRCERPCRPIPFRLSSRSRCRTPQFGLGWYNARHRTEAAASALAIRGALQYRALHRLPGSVTGRHRSAPSPVPRCITA